jgi:hypothetical protein
VAAALAEGDSEAASELVERRVGRKSEDPETVSLRASVLEFVGDTRGAEHVLQRGIREFPGRESLLRELVELHADHGAKKKFEAAAGALIDTIKGARRRRAMEAWVALKKE